MRAGQRAGNVAGHRDLCAEITPSLADAGLAAPASEPKRWRAACSLRAGPGAGDPGGGGLGSRQACRRTLPPAAVSWRGAADPRDALHRPARRRRRQRCGQWTHGPGR